MKREGATNKPGEQAPPRCGSAFEAGSGPKRKKGPGGQRISLIKLDSAKEIQEFGRAKF